MVVEGNWSTNLSSILLSGKIALERERLADERKERDRRFELESQERHVIMDLLKEKVLKGWSNTGGKPICSIKKEQNEKWKDLWLRFETPVSDQKNRAAGVSKIRNTKWDLKLLMTLLKPCATNVAIAPKVSPRADHLCSVFNVA